MAEAPTRHGDRDAADRDDADRGDADRGDAACLAHERVARALASAASTAEAVPAVLHAIADCLGFKLAALWVADANERLTCLELWHDEQFEAAQFERMTWNLRLGADAGAPGLAHELPAIAHETGAPVWCVDAAAGRGRRNGAAAFDGVHAGVALPLGDGAVAEFYAGEPRPRDAAVIEHLAIACADLRRFLQEQQLRRELAHETPTTIHEEVVESLWLAQSALETGRIDQAARLLDESIDAAQRIATEASEVGRSGDTQRRGDV